MTLNTSPGFTVAAWKKGNGYERINNRRKAMLDILATSYVTQSWAILGLTVITVAVLIIRAIDRSEERESAQRVKSNQAEAMRDLTRDITSEIRYLRQGLPKKRP